MKPKKIIYIRLKNHSGLPSVFFRINSDFGFCFLIDTGVKHNLLDRCFYEEWINYIPAPSLSDAPGSILHYPGLAQPAHQNAGTKRIMCKDGVRRICEITKFSFTIENEDTSDKYSECFAIDPGVCRYFNAKKSKSIVGVLGNDFLKKHQWILDYSK